jgi:hypothetical protein
MSDPALPMLAAAVAALKAEPSLTALVSDRVHDRAPQRVIFPYVQVGNLQVIADDAECIDGFEVYIDVHAWSRAYGTPETRQICSAVHTALHQASLPLSTFSLVEIRHESTRVLGDPDGETSHGIVTFRALVDRL